MIKLKMIINLYQAHKDKEGAVSVLAKYFQEQHQKDFRLKKQCLKVNNLFKSQLADLIKHKKIHLVFVLSKILLIKVCTQPTNKT